MFFVTLMNLLGAILTATKGSNPRVSVGATSSVLFTILISTFACCFTWFFLLLDTVLVLATKGIVKKDDEAN